MAISKKQKHEEIRSRYMKSVMEFLTNKGEEVLITGSQEIAIPCLDCEGDDEYIVITFKYNPSSRNVSVVFLRPMDGFSPS